MKSSISKFSVFAILLVAGLSIGFFYSCEEKEDGGKDENNVIITTEEISVNSFTACKNSENSVKDDSTEESVDLNFIGDILYVSHTNLRVPCDSDSILTSHTFNNSTLNIDVHGNNGFVNCLCPIDLEYTVFNVDTNVIKVIIINFDTVYNHSSK